jgi:hypothetical protein
MINRDPSVIDNFCVNEVAANEKKTQEASPPPSSRRAPRIDLTEPSEKRIGGYLTIVYSPNNFMTTKAGRSRESYRLFNEDL